MAHRPVGGLRLPGAWMPALLIGVGLSILVGAGVYSLLAQQDQRLVAQRQAAASAAAEQQGRATAKTVVWLTEPLLTDQLALVQQTLEKPWPQADLLDLSLIAQDRVIVASRRPETIGTKLLDPAWLAASNLPTGSVTSSLEQGRPTLVVVEPIRAQGRVVGWVRLVTAAPRATASPRSNDELLREAATIAVPFGVLLVLALAWTLRGMMNRVRALLGRVLHEATSEIDLESDKTALQAKTG